jgi:hypothetical protein
MNRVELAELPQPRNQSYLEFDLDAETMALVEKLAVEEGVTPFEMCVTLLEERCKGLATD